MTEIVPGVHVMADDVGTAVPGGALNLCLLVEHGRVTMIDAGLPGSAAGVFAYLETIGLSAKAVRRVIVTHHHVDHVGGLAEIVAASGAEVWAHRDDTAVIEGAEPRSGIPAERVAAMLASLPEEQRAAAADRLEQLAHIAPATVDLRLVGGEELNVLGGVRVVHSPGHTPGHLCLYLPGRSLLIAGDLLRLVNGVIDLSPAALSTDNDLSLASARRVVALGFEGFVGYHGGYTVAGAGKLLSERLVG
jgi:glyoxylase-like metal-dependent hydrolase (beta-lactamase superfamily II)